MITWQEKIHLAESGGKIECVICKKIDEKDRNCQTYCTFCHVFVFMKDGVDYKVSMFPLEGKYPVWFFLFWRTILSNKYNRKIDKTMESSFESQLNKKRRSYKKQTEEKNIILVYKKKKRRVLRKEKKKKSRALYTWYKKIIKKFDEKLEKWNLGAKKTKPKREVKSNKRMFFAEVTTERYIENLIFFEKRQLRNP